MNKDKILQILAVVVLASGIITVLVMLILESQYPDPDTKYHIRVKMVDGSYSDIDTILPHTSKFKIYGSDGTYHLRCMRSRGDNGLMLKNAVIDFEVLSQERIDTTSKQVELAP